MSKSTFVDLSHTIEDGMVTYKGLPPPIITDFITRANSSERYAPGTQFQIGKIEMIANTGTYIDSPFHRYEEAPDLAGFQLDSLANLEGLAVRHVGEAERALEAAAFSEMEFSFPTAADRAMAHYGI